MRLLKPTLASKLFLLLLPLAFVPLLAIVAQWHFIAKGQIANELKLRLKTRWNTIEEEIQSFFTRKEGRIKEVAISPLVKDLFGYLKYGLKEESDETKLKMREYFSQLSQEHPTIHRICLSFIKGEGQVKFLKDGLRSGHNPRTSFKCPTTGAAEERFAIQIKQPDIEINEPFIQFRSQLLDLWGEPWAILTFDVPVHELSLLLGKLLIPEEGVGLIYDEKSKIITCAINLNNPSQGESCSNPSYLEEWERSLSKAKLNKYKGEVYKDHVIFSEKLPITPMRWFTTLAVPVESYDKNFLRLRKNTFYAGLLFFVVALLVLLPLTRRATAPLRSLEELSRKIAAGDFRYRIPIASRDEIGRLARAFNQMAESLANRDTRLRQQAESIAARNEELETLNRILGRASMSLNMETLLPALLDEILTAMSLKVGTIRLIDEEKGTLKLVASEGLSKTNENSQEVIQLGGDFIGKVARTGEPIFIKDVEADPAANKLVNRIHGQDLRCFAAVPIVANNKPIGVLALGATKNDSFRQTDLSSLVSIGLGIGACIENAHLYANLEDAYQRLKSLQESLIQAEKLSAMGKLVAGVAHEINNPLTAILGYSQFIQNKLDNPKHEDAVRAIVEQSKRCARIVENLLIFARKTEKQEEILDLYDVVDEVVSTARMTLSLNNIKVTTKVARNECSIIGDRYQLQQVFLNLITNAQHAMEEIKDLKLLQIHMYPDGDHCVVDITDNGKGIPQEAERKIFDPFFTTKPVGKGTGLGLSLSYGIVKEHGGDISFTSEVGIGTTVSVRLPKTEKTPETTESQNSPTSWEDVAGYHILIVDDERSICHLLETSLSAKGLRVSMASSVIEAQETIQDTQPDFILSDIRLNNESGFQLYEMMVSARLLRADQFVFMSGDRASQETLDKIHETKCNFLKKPFEIEDLKRILINCLEKAGKSKQA